VSRLDAAIAALATLQYGLISRAQALEAGCSPAFIEYRLATGRWEQLHPGVYRIAGVPGSWEQDVMAACLASGGRASHLSAAALHGLIERRSGSIEVVAEFGRHPRHASYIAHRTRRPLEETAFVGPIPVTTPARTLVDIAGVIGEAALEQAVHVAVRRKLVSRADLLNRLTTSGLPGLTKLRRVLDRLGDGPATDGHLETEFLQLLRTLDVPEPERQHVIRRGGVAIARADLAYPSERVVIELDGYEFHSSPAAFRQDRVRQNALQEAGYVVLRFTKRDIGRPRYIKDTILRLLFERGHPEVVSL
jgi:very-short-patch-repair endonuclease